MRIGGTEADPAASRFEPDPSRSHSQMARTEPSIKINSRHADAIVTDPERSRTSFASEFDQDRTRLGMLDNVGDQLPGGGQQQFIDRPAS